MLGGGVAAAARPAPRAANSTSRPITAAVMRTSAGPRSRVPALAAPDATVLLGGDDNGFSCVGGTPSYERTGPAPGVKSAWCGCGISQLARSDHAADGV